MNSNANELNYTPFTNTTNKTGISLTPIFGSMIALSDLPNDNDVNPPAIVPKNAKIKQKSTLSKVTNEDINTVGVVAKLPFISNLYIASLTVVGLFVLFRFIQKHP